MTTLPPSRTVTVGAAQLTVSTWGSGPPAIVLAHDGLGSISQWRDVPAALHDATGLTVAAYDRAGHGRSTPAPTGPWPADWLHREAEVLARLLEQLDAPEAALVGHSDGGSIALLHAASGQARSRAVVAVASHTFVEQICVDAIAAMRASNAPIIAGLARHHAEPAAVFEAWSGVWVSEAFRPWDIRPSLAAITAPTLIIQGDADEYATDAQFADTVAAIPGARGELLPGVGHLVPHQAPDELVRLVAEHVTGR